MANSNPRPSNASGLAFLGLAVAGVMAWRNRDKITTAVKKAQESATKPTAPNATDIPVSDAL